MAATPTLNIISGINIDREYEYPCGLLVTIGRSRTNDILLSDPKVSRSHALVRCLGDGNYYLIDMGSTNGTFVNKKRVVTPQPLAPSDKIHIGDHVLEFRSKDDFLDSELKEEDLDETQSTVVSFGSVIHQITVLVTDIRGYTSLSELMPVNRLADMLGKWFGVVSEIVEQNQGVIDKFIGDAVMVRWLTEYMEPEEIVVAALKTAYALNKASNQFNLQFPNLPHPLRIGVGINTGQAVVGTLGSVRDYTAIGDAVNLAFRFETCTKELNTDVVLGPDSYKLLPDTAWKKGCCSVFVKGKEQPITVCALSFADLAGVVPES